MKGIIVHAAYWIANSFLWNQGRPPMQIRGLHNAISLEGDKGVKGLRCPFVVWQSFSVSLLKAERFDILTGSAQNIPKAVECTYFSW